MDPRSYNFIGNLIYWYKNNGRDLPWRNTRDPYRIWLSEIILQQTRVDQGLPYFLNFLKNFPTLKSLGNSSEEMILRHWQGLGYYSRARNLFKCARVILDEHKGKFPETFEELIKLPGIGPYTAAAIASFAFKQPVVALDGNALRVFSRVFGIHEDISKASTVNTIRTIATEIIPKDEPDFFNQAVMELGATICQPGNPRCDSCPIANNCEALMQGDQQMLPIKKNSTRIRKRYFNYVVLKKDKKIAMFKRPGNDIWEGLYDFYLLESEHLMEPEDIPDPFILDILAKGGTVDVIVPEKKHILSHQIIFSRFIEIRFPENILNEEFPKQPPIRFYSKNEIQDLPKPVLVNNFLNSYFSETS